MRVFPISNWTEADIWQYIKRENIEIVPLYILRRIVRLSEETAISSWWMMTECGLREGEKIETWQ